MFTDFPICSHIFPYFPIIQPALSWEFLGSPPRVPASRGASVLQAQAADHPPQRRFADVHLEALEACLRSRRGVGGQHCVYDVYDVWYIYIWCKSIWCKYCMLNINKWWKYIWCKYCMIYIYMYDANVYDVSIVWYLYIYIWCKSIWCKYCMLNINKWWKYIWCKYCMIYIYICMMQIYMM